MLKKKEVVYRYVLTEALEKRRYRFTQLEISRRFGFSLSTVNNSLKHLEGIGAIEKRARGFEIVDTKKALIFWASIRNLKKDIIYTTRAEKDVQKIEGEMPSEVVFTAYSAYYLKYNDAPADYSEVYVYYDRNRIDEIEERFPRKKGPPNIFVLEKDEFMPEDSLVPIPQMYVDLWNLKEWYAKDFLNALELRLFK